MSDHPRPDGPAHTPPPAADTNGGNRPPAGPPLRPTPLGEGENNRPTVKTFKDVFKIMVAVTVWFATTDAVAALREAARYVELSRLISLLDFPLGSVPNTVTWGLTIGVVHGLILGVKALVFIWVGPTFFEYLYPVFVAASRITARVVNDVRRAWIMGTNWRPDRVQLPDAAPAVIEQPDRDDTPPTGTPPGGDANNRDGTPPTR